MKIIYVVSEDWYFVSHRLPLAEEAIRRGWEVVLLSRFATCEQVIRDKGIKTIHVELIRGGLNPFRDAVYCRELARLYRREKPDLVHHVAMKPCLYGSIAARRAGVRCYVNAIAGLGTLFSSKSLSIRLVRPLVLRAFARLFGHENSQLILQNPDDVEDFVQCLKLDPSRISLVRGSGVDLDKFYPAEVKPQGDSPLIVMVSRLLLDKGVTELIRAAKLLKERSVPCRVALVGDADLLNVHAVPQDVLREAETEGAVELWGRRTDIPAIYQQADIAVLPSYREGLPKALIEAASCGLPIVTTDVPGCREVVEPEVNGLLVPPRDPVALADALERLIGALDARHGMGEASRRKAEEEFGIIGVVKQTFDVYGELLEAGQSQ